MKRLESTRDIPPGTIVRIYRKGFGYARLTVSDQNERYIGLDAGSEIAAVLAEGDRVEAYLWVENDAAYQCILVLLGKAAIDPPVLFFEHTAELDWNEERTCLTADVSIPIRFFILDTGDRVKSVSVETINFLQGTVVKLGDRSAVIHCTDHLDYNVFYKGHVTIGGEDIEMVGKVKPEPEDHPDHYLLTYIGMHERERTMLLDYVFSVYRE